MIRSSSNNAKEWLVLSIEVSSYQMKLCLRMYEDVELMQNESSIIDETGNFTQEYTNVSGMQWSDIDQIIVNSFWDILNEQRMEFMCFQKRLINGDKVRNLLKLIRYGKHIATKNISQIKKLVKALLTERKGSKQR